ncbi:ATP-binding protein [Evansella sp. AB-rgal1]|uniref:ATP-binding protein n=1 Tax=Evansella sp. AB-rgal1 TaxID=3242696 RepID=UPI00359DDCF0
MKRNLIYKRNRLLIKLLALFYILMTVVYFVMDPQFSTIWPPVGLVIVLFLLIIYKRSQNPILTMYIMILGYFSYIFYLLIQYPYLVNYIFILLGLILCSIYQSYIAIIVGGLITKVLLVYFFVFHFESIFMNVDYPFDIAYFILFSLLMMLFFFFQLRFTNSLWKKVEEKEQKAKHELHSQQEYLYSFFHQTGEAIIVIDLQGNVKTVNPAFEKLYGWKEIEIENGIAPIIPIENRKITEERLGKVKEGKKIDTIVTKHRRKNGDFIDVEVSLSPIRDLAGEVIAISGVIRDITEKKRTEEKLLNAEKLSLLGEMAAGIAHEIRNPLTVVSGYIQFLRKKNDNETDKYDIMLSELKRIDSIMSELLVLGKPQAVDYKSQQIPTIFEEVLSLYEVQCETKSIVVHKDFQKKLPPVSCEKNHLKQVFINLVKNAMEAMPDGGEITVSVKMKNHNTLSIIVQDTGIGISPSIIEKLGDPFFSTKRDGTGLGLMISKRIIESHHGKLQIESEVKKGTKLEILLPTINE